MENKSKIVFISGAIPPAHCGVGDYTHCLMNALVDKGCEVHVITDVKYKGNDTCKYQIHSVVNKWEGWSFFKVVLSTLKTIGCNLVHIQYPTIEYKWHPEINILPFILKLYGYKVIYTIHEYSQRPFLSRVRRWPSVASSDLTIVVEKKFEVDLKKLFFLKSNVVTIPIGSNIPHSTILKSEKKSFKSKIAKGYDGILAAYFGFINPNKVFELVIEVLGELKSSGKLWFKLLVVSELDEKDQYQKKILEMIRFFQLQDDIIVTGYVSNEQVGNYIAICDFAIALFQKGVSIRNGSFLALRQENIPIITTFPQNGNHLLNNTLYIQNNKNQLIEKLLLIKQDVGKDINNEVITWEEIADRHMYYYIKFSE